MNRKIDARCHKEQAADDALAVVITDERSSSVEVCFAELVEAIGKNKIAVSYRKDNEITVETNVIVLEDEKTITYVIALRRPGLLIGPYGETIESVIKETGERMLWTSHIKQKEIKIDLIETLSKWSAVRRMEEIIDFHYNF